MADAITVKALQDASLDAKSLEEVVNGNDTKQVTTRLGENYPSVKKAIKTLFENGSLPATPFATKALMTASALIDGDYAMVTDDTVNNGLYVKTAGAWVKSDYDPLTQAKTYTDSRINNVATYAVVGKSDINIYEKAKAISDLYINTSDSIVQTSTGSFMYSFAVTEGQVFIFNNKDPILTISFSNIATVTVGSQLQAADKVVTTEDSTQVTVPSGVSYIHFNVKIAALNAYETLVVNQAELALTKYDGKDIADTAARLAAADKVGLSDMVTSGYLSAIVELPTSGFYINNTTPGTPLFAADAGGIVQRYPLVAGETYAVHSDNFSHSAFIVAASDTKDITVSKTLTPITLSDTAHLKVKTFVAPNGVNWGFTTVKLPSLGFDITASFDVNIGTQSSKINPANVFKIKGYEVRDTVAQQRLDALGLGNNSVLQGKKWALIGDSITEKNIRAGVSYFEHVSNDVGGMTIYNYGNSGTGFFDRNGVAAQISQTDIDIITVFLGTNDWGKSTQPLGVFLDTGTTTVSGCINTLLTGVITKFFNKKIAVFTPLPRADNWGSNAATNTQGYTLEQLSKLISQYCDHYSLPRLDLYHKSGLPVWVTEANNLYFKADMDSIGDGLHPNTAGMRVMADKIRPFLESI